MGNRCSLVKSRLNGIAHLLSLIIYEDLTPGPIELPPRYGIEAIVARRRPTRFIT